MTNLLNLLRLSSFLLDLQVLMLPAALFAAHRSLGVNAGQRVVRNRGAKWVKPPDMGRT